MDYMASSLYGSYPVVQPNSSGQPDHPAGTPSPTVRTAPAPTGLRNPVAALVGVVGLAILLISRLK